MNGIIVGIDQGAAGKAYRVILYKRSDKGYEFERRIVSEPELVNAMLRNGLVIDNAEVSGNKLKGKTGDLSRFNTAKGFHPMVILAEIVADDVVIGYRVAKYDWMVSAVRIKEVMAYCARVSNNGSPFQNAQYVPETNGSKAHLRSFPGHPFYRETLKRERSTIAKPANPDKKENQKQVSRLEELFNSAQIKQLKLGKEHGVNIKIFGNNKLSSDQMEQLRLALEDGVNAKAFADPAYSVQAMKALRINAKYGVDVTYFVNPKFNAEQVYELSTGYLSGVDITKYADPTISAKEMSKKRVELESQIWKDVEVKEAK